MKYRSMKLNAALNSIKAIMSMIFPLITFPYVSRVLQVSNMGKVNFSNSVVNYFVLIAGLGVATYAIREGSRVRDDEEKLEEFASEVFSINLLTTILSYVAFVVVIILFSKLHQYYPLLIVQSFMIIGSTIGVDWLYSIKEEYFYIALRSIVVQLCSIVLMFIFVKSRNDYIIYAAIITFSATAANVFNYIYARKQIHFHLTWNLNLKKHIGPILIIFTMTAATTIYVNSDITLLGLLSGSKGDYFVGIYSTATKVYSILKSVMVALIVVSLPRLSNYLARGLNDLYNESVYKILNAFLTLLLPIMVGLFFASKEVILLLAGENYIAGTSVLKILCVSLLFSVFAVFYTNAILLPFRMEKVVMHAMVVSAIFNFLLNFIMIPKFGYIGSAITTMISEFIVLVWECMSVRNKIRLKINWKDLRSTIIGCFEIAIVCTICEKLHIGIYEILCLKIGVSVLIFFTTLYLFRNSLIMDAVNKIKKRM